MDPLNTDYVYIVSGGTERRPESDLTFLITREESQAVAYGRGLFAAPDMSWVSVDQYRIPFERGIGLVTEGRNTLFSGQR